MSEGRLRVSVDGCESSDRSRGDSRTVCFLVLGVMGNRRHQFVVFVDSVGTRSGIDDKFADFKFLRNCLLLCNLYGDLSC